MQLNDVFALNRPFFLIAGPCVLEGNKLHDDIAFVLDDIRNELEIPVIFKASFDKANRSQWGSPRGPGPAVGVAMLERIKKEFNLPVLTDIHEPWQAEHMAQVCDVLQIPANLCRQTDLIMAAAKTGKPINLKKGQWVGTAEMKGAVTKVRIGQELFYPLAITERGTFFGYGDLVVDMRNMVHLREECQVPIIFDGTHSVQRPGLGRAGTSGGYRECIESLVLAAVAAGADGLYLEVHPQPERAPSDSECMLPLNRLLPLMRDVMAIRQILERSDALVCEYCGRAYDAEHVHDHCRVPA